MRFLPFLLLFVAAVGLADPPRRGRLAEILEYAREQGVTESCPSLLETVPTVPEHLRLRTERLTLRPLGYEDLGPLVAILTHPRVMEMSGDYLDVPSIQYLMAMGAQPDRTLSQGEMINFGIFDGDRLIGMSQIAATEPHVARERGIARHGELWVELSYHLHPDAWGRGYAQEITRATSQLAFQRFDAAGLHGQTIASNDGSGRVLTRLGLTMIEERGGNRFYAMRRPAP